MNNENTVYEILEKKVKSIEEIIEKELENKVKNGSKKELESKQKTYLDKEENTKRRFRIQVASFKERRKSLEISKKLMEEFSLEKDINFEVKKNSFKKQ